MTTGATPDIPDHLAEACDTESMMTTTGTWNTWTLPSNLAKVAEQQYRDERTADRWTDELLRDITSEWRAMVKDVRFTLHGGADSPERRLAYTARRISAMRASLRGYLHRPEYRAYDEALEAVELRIAG